MGFVAQIRKRLISLKKNSDVKLIIHRKIKGLRFICATKPLRSKDISVEPALRVLTRSGERRHSPPGVC
jgi:hypothetical protein